MVNNRHKAYSLIARKFIPNRLAAAVFINVVAKATTGKHANTNVPELTAMDALQRFQEDNGI